MKFKPYMSYSLPRMAHFRGFNSPKISWGPRGIGSRSPNPQGMKKCNPRFPESPMNESRRGIGIPTSNWIYLVCGLWPQNNNMRMQHWLNYKRLVRGVDFWNNLQYYLSASECSDIGRGVDAGVKPSKEDSSVWQAIVCPTFRWGDLNMYLALGKGMSGNCNLLIGIGTSLRFLILLNSCGVSEIFSC